MREIKFRGETASGEVIIGNLTAPLKRKKGAHWYIRGWLQGAVEQLIPLSREVNPVTVGQYTGFKDAEAQELYERDLLIRVDDDSDTEYRVMYDKENGSWIVVNAKDQSRFVEQLDYETSKKYVAVKELKI